MTDRIRAHVWLTVGLLVVPVIHLFSLGWFYYYSTRADFGLRGDVSIVVNSPPLFYDNTTRNLAAKSGDMSAYHFSPDGLVNRIDHGEADTKGEMTIVAFDVYEYDSNQILKSEASYGASEDDVLASLSYIQKIEGSTTTLSPGSVTGSDPTLVIPFTYKIEQNQHRTVFVYLKDGSLRSEVRLGKQGLPEEVKENITLSKAHVGIRIRSYGEDGQLLRDTLPSRYDKRYTYDNNGLETVEQDYNGAKLSGEFTFTYRLDSRGNWTERTMYKGSGTDRQSLRMDIRQIKYYSD